MAKQYINAMEWARRESAHLYKAVADSQRKLRESILISTLEDASRKTQWLRSIKSHQLKAAGTTSATLTDEEKDRLATYWLEFGSSTAPQKMRIALRDYAMFIVSCTFGFRGESIRSILQSDLFLHSIKRLLGHRVMYFPALFVFANNSKMNKDGRIDQVAVMRHRSVLSCPVFAIMLQLWAYYELHGQCAAVDFEPDFSEASQEECFGIFGKRPWYEDHLFYGGNPKRAMAPSNASSFPTRCLVLSPLQRMPTASARRSRKTASRPTT
jgi:hypothetical protein